MNIYLDFGFNYGQGYDHLNQQYHFDDLRAPWYRYGWEPNSMTLPRAQVRARERGVRLFPAAVWTDDIPQVFQRQAYKIGGPEHGVGSRLPTSPWSLPDGKAGHEIVPCMGLDTILCMVGIATHRPGSFLRELDKADTLVPGSQIVMKMDIEGAEYPVLRSALWYRWSHLIPILHVEFHWRFMEGKETEASTKALIAELELKGTKVYNHDYDNQPTTP